jgi:hypothetical protein
VFTYAHRSLAALVLLAVVFSASALAAPQQDTAVLFEVLNEGRPMDLKVTTTGDGTRLDMIGGEEGDVSMVWASGGMLMIMHSRQMYMEFTREMMDRMKQMMAAMGRAPEVETEVEIDPGSFSFERTGNTETINGMDSFEVSVTGPDGEQSMLWMTEDSEIGLFETFVRMMEPMQEMSMPGMDNPMGKFSDYMSLAKASGLPDGRVIRVVDSRNGSQITLKEAMSGPFGDDILSAPAGYQKQAMPMMQR